MRLSANSSISIEIDRPLSPDWRSGIPEEDNSMAVNFRPLSDKVLVKPSAGEERSAGGIYIPDSAQQKPIEGEVIAVGPGKVLEDGKRSVVAVAIGDKVIYSKYGGTELKLDGEDYIILDENQIYAVKA
jgi:chaperonin GroES